MHAAHLLVLFGLLVQLALCHKDLYKVLGVPRSATIKDIKRAYKKLALEFHPDKNSAPGAQDRFMEVAEAHEVLTDPQRKERYDRFGTIDDSSANHNAGFRYRNGGPYDDWFFGFGENQEKQAVFEKHRLTHHMYLHSVLEASYTKPFLIFAYSRYCPACFALQSYWTDAVNDLEPLGYGIGTVNYVYDANLFDKLRIGRVPSVVVLVEGKVVHYRGNYQDLSARTIRVFARDAIPNSFILRLNSYSGLRRFLDQWETTNKPSVLFFGANKEPRLRYLLLAMKYSHFARFAYVNMQEPSKDIGDMKAALNIRCTGCENVLVFAENPKEGEVSKLHIAGSQFTTEQLNEFMQKNKFLKFPRASSMHYLDELCPVSARSQKHFCLIYPIEGDADESDYVDQVRDFIDSNKGLLSNLRVRIFQLSVKAHPDFMKSFIRNDQTARRSLLVMWRYEYVKGKYSWLPLSTNRANFASQLRDDIAAIARGDFRLTETASVGKLIDEYIPSIFTRFSRHVIRMASTIWFHISKEEALPILSVCGTLLFILGVGYLLNHLAGDHKLRTFEPAPEKPPPYSEKPDWHPEDPSNPQRNNSTAGKKKAWQEMERIIHELRAETYFGLIRLLKPGCRSIIILVDAESKDVLLPQFARYVYPLRKNKTFSFGYLMVDKNVKWFSKLLEHILPATDDGQPSKMAPRLKEINPKQTIGTVLVLCGYKLYFCMYHPLHTGSRIKDSDETSSDEVDAESAKDPQSRRISQQNVLDGFPNFLDRLLEGSIRRYYVPEWPDNLK